MVLLSVFLCGCEWACPLFAVVVEWRQKGGTFVKTFSDFKKSIDFNKLAYDMKMLSLEKLIQSSNLFTQEQYAFLTETTAVMSLALLQQYHEWLNETQQP